VDLSKSRVSKDGVKEFRKALVPNAQVVH
jgi:hypothetical protein